MRDSQPPGVTMGSTGPMAPLLYRFGKVVQTTTNVTAALH
jgi:hypothetical protein